MRSFPIAAVSMAFAAGLFAQTEVLEQRRNEKLGKPVFARAEWLADYDAALARAAKDGKLVLLYFTRSFAP